MAYNDRVADIKLGSFFSQLNYEVGGTVNRLTFWHVILIKISFNWSGGAFDEWLMWNPSKLFIVDVVLHWIAIVAVRHCGKKPILLRRWSSLTYGGCQCSLVIDCCVLLIWFEGIHSSWMTFCLTLSTSMTRNLFNLSSSFHTKIYPQMINKMQQQAVSVFHS